jgi:hypothetical protein
MSNKCVAAVELIDQDYAGCHRDVSNQFVRVAVIGECLEEVD